MAVLALIPARGGSKRLPGKNLAQIGGRSLVEIAVATAHGVDRFDGVLVSSDDEAILDAGERAGATPLRRPASLARDETRTVDVVRHAVRERGGVDIVAVLQPTSPLRTAADVTVCLDRLDDPSVFSVTTVTELEHPRTWEFELDDSNRLEPVTGWDAMADRRQDAPPAYRLNGAVYVIQADALLEGSPLVGPGTVGVTMPSERSIDIDTALDLQIARLLAGTRA